MSEVLIIEKTSSSASHYELAGLFAIFLAQLQMSTALQQKAEATMAEQKQAIDEFKARQEEQEADEEPSEVVTADPWPFVTVPEGTTDKPLPDGGKLFTLSDGAMVRVGADLSLYFVGLDGATVLLAEVKGGMVRLPDGRELQLVQEARIATHEDAGISGLPLDIDAVKVNEGCYSVVFPDGLQLGVSHPERRAVLINSTGSLVLLSLPRIEGIGEGVESRLLSGGAKSFSCSESGHKGMIDGDDTIRVALNNGLDLVIRFPSESSGNTHTQTSDEPSTFVCEGCCS